MTDPFRAKPKPSSDDGPLDVATGGVMDDGGGALLGVAGPPPAGLTLGPVDDDHGSDGITLDDDEDGQDEQPAAVELEPLPVRHKLDAMRKADLKALADRRGVTYDGDATKDELVDALEAAAGR